MFGAWLGLATALLGYAYAFGSPFPYFDDMAILASWANEEPATSEWFFRPWNGHVIPFTRVALVSCWAFADGNLRPLLLCSAGILAVASLWVLVELRRMKGGLTPEDCLIPLAILGCHAYSDTIWAINWNNVLAAALTAMIAATILRTGTHTVAGGVVWFAAATGVLAFQGGAGLLAAVGFIPALSLLAWRTRASTPARTSAIVVTMTLLVAIVVGLLVFRGFASPSVNATGTATRSLIGSFVRAARPLSLPAGWLSVRAWPLGALLVGGAIGAVVWESFHQRARNSNALLVALTLLPGLLVCAGLAAARNGLVHPRYIGMVVPLWVPIYFGMQMVVNPPTRHLITLATLIVLALSFGYGFTPTFKEGRSRVTETERLQAAIDKGMSFDQLAAAHGHAWGQEIIATQFSQNLAAIARLGKGTIAKIPALPTLAFTPVAVAPSVIGDLPDIDGRWRSDAGGAMHIPLADEKIDAVRIVLDAAGGNYGLQFGIGVVDTDSQGWRTGAYELRMIYPDEETGPGERPVYTVTYPLPPGATGVVLVAPAGCRDISLQSVAYGRLNDEQTSDRLP